MKRPSTKRATRLEFAAIEIVGALMTPDMVTSIAAVDAANQTPEEYATQLGLKLRDEIARYFRIGEALWARFEATRAASPTASERFMLDLLTQCFGFTSLVPQATIAMGEREFPIRHSALDGRVPVVVAPQANEESHRPGIDESLTQFADGNRRRSATLLLQEYLNAEDKALWGIAADGNCLRLMRDNMSLTRPAWIEADLSKIFAEGLFADFTALWLLIHQSRFGLTDADVSDCPLEHWRERGKTEGVAARNKLRQGVEAAIAQLGQGFLEHPDNVALRQALNDGSLTPQSYFEELLRLVYRLIFLFAAEDRDLLHTPETNEAARSVYNQGYSLSRLRERSIRRTSRDRHIDAWDGLKATFKALSTGEPRLGLAALGGLFARGQTAHLTASKIENHHFLESIWRLAWLRPDGQPLTRVNWRDMETEELGSVYESLLELTPRASADTRTFTFAEGLETQGNARKISGSYYTPDALVKLLLDTTLDPVLDDAEARNPDDPASEILKLTIIDPACGSGHFLLGAARRAAARIAKLRSPGAPSKAEFQHALREVVSHCIYGVDRNPMAVELCKVALWIEALEPGKPLSYLDARIRCGDSLIGVFKYEMLKEGIPDEAYKALTGDIKETANTWKKFNKEQRDGKGATGFLKELRPSETLLDAAKLFAEMPEDTLEQIEAKRQAFTNLHSGDSWLDLKIACDLYVSAFFIPKTGEKPEARSLGKALMPLTETVWRAARGERPYGPLAAKAIDVADSVKAFHWPLEFPEIFALGGFDVILGNPPWDTLSPDAKEFFSPYDGAVRFMAKAEQTARFDELRQLPGVSESWDAYCRNIYATAAFIKQSGRYKLFAKGNLGKGDFNIYRMFVELALAGINARGRAAQFVPENLYNGANAAEIRSHLYEKKKLEALIAFENTGKIWFDIDSRAKFCLYVASHDGPTDIFPCAFGVNSKEKLTAIAAELPIEMPVSLIDEFSPEARAIAEVAHPFDITVSKKIYARFPKFGAEIEDLPQRIYSREVDMGTDRDLFIEDSSEVPIYEGRMVEAFDHRAKKYVSGRGRSAKWDNLEFGSPAKQISPQWHIAEDDVPAKLSDRWQQYRVGFCDVGGVTNSRFFMTTLIPPHVVSGHSVPTIIFSVDSSQLMMLWLGITNAFCVDFLARKKGANHMTYTVLDSLPLPRQFTGTKAEIAIAQRALCLAATGPEMNDFWQETAPLLGLDPIKDAPVENIDKRRTLRTELDVLVARDIFDLTIDEIQYVLNPSKALGEDCGFETFGALKRAEEREFGRFLSQDLILEAWGHLALPGDVAQVETRTAEVVALPTAPPPLRLPDLAPIPDSDWVRVGANGEVGDMLTAILKAMSGPMPISRVRLAVLLALESDLLLPHLDSEPAAHWTRLTGTKPSTTFDQIATQWGEAVRHLRALGMMVEDLESETWGPGTGLSEIKTDGWPDGRALMVLDALRRIGESAVIHSLPQHTWERWTNAEAA